MKLFNMAFVIHWLVVNHFGNRRDKKTVYNTLLNGFDDIRKKKEFFGFSNLFFKINADPFWHFFRAGIYCYISYMRSCRYTRRPKLVSDYIMSIYICHFLCTCNLSLSLGFFCTSVLHLQTSFAAHQLLVADCWNSSQSKIAMKKWEVVWGQSLPSNYGTENLMYNGVFHELELNALCKHVISHQI